MEFEEWWGKQTANFDPEEIGLMQLARVTWHAAKDVERAACAMVCEAKAKALGERADLHDDDEDAIELKARAWQMTVLAAELRERSNVKCPS